MNKVYMEMNCKETCGLCPSKSVDFSLITFAPQKFMTKRVAIMKSEH